MKDEQTSLPPDASHFVLQCLILIALIVTAPRLPANADPNRRYVMLYGVRYRLIARRSPDVPRRRKPYPLEPITLGDWLRRARLDRRISEPLSRTSAIGNLTAQQSVLG